MLRPICKCINCGTFHIDTNPQVNVKLYDTSKFLVDLDELKTIDDMRACTECSTDGYLVDVGMDIAELLPLINTTNIKIRIGICNKAGRCLSVGIGMLYSLLMYLILRIVMKSYLGLWDLSMVSYLVVSSLIE